MNRLWIYECAFSLVVYLYVTWNDVSYDCKFIWHQHKTKMVVWLLILCLTLSATGNRDAADCIFVNKTPGVDDDSTEDENNNVNITFTTTEVLYLASSVYEHAFQYFGTITFFLWKECMPFWVWVSWFVTSNQAQTWLACFFGLKYLQVPIP